ncbi:MotE family protein [Cytobacillus horneckiae]|uniref:Magnesium transporter MgtE intracellular domain-containing protein n=1 Tax=Cytobacillus horneckiae TaxID=549687 RepID=A0A2N0ZM22_9BACI|nr:hypothetical protein [Cytobacillus horneckiae]MEC1157017.1 hypothetical protein [Cytobacillus horneckiae]MED2939957.1 hypothetical protein [Cytobacillus horneckiae]PKG30553.1 hypothetical protein CWS20_02780 [Cytobacillus horneckiae]
MVKVNEKQNSKPLSKFFMIGAISIIGIIAIVLLILTISGYNIFDMTKKYGQNIPVISSLFQEDQSKKVAEMETQLIEMEAEVKDREARIAQLEGQMKSKDDELKRSQLDNGRLEEEMDELIAMNAENKRAFKDIVRTYETMSPKKAALILAGMNEQDALRILADVKPDVLASILEKMEADTAAKFTNLLTASLENNQADESN